MSSGDLQELSRQTGKCWRLKYEVRVTPVLCKTDGGSGREAGKGSDWTKGRNGRTCEHTLFLSGVGFGAGAAICECFRESDFP